MNKILIISTSPRSGSNSEKVMNYLSKLFIQEEATVDTASFITYRPTSVGDGYVSPVLANEFEKSLIAKIEGADQVIWVVPEYNRLVPAELVSWLHHFGGGTYSAIWKDKIHAVVGVSSTIGGRGALAYFRNTFNYIIGVSNGKNCFVSPYSFQSINTGENLNDQGGFVGDERYERNAIKFTKQILGSYEK